MKLRQELNSHSEKTWIIGIPESGDKTGNLTPLVDLIDWFNNQLLTKSLLARKIKLGFGERTLMATSGLTAAQRLLVVGLGSNSELGVTQARKFLQDLGQALEDLQETQAWLVLSSQIPAKFIDEIRKSRTSIDQLSQVTISVG